MKSFKVDLHMHTVLSPCGSLEMSPMNIVKTALENDLDIIGITDHNSTRQCAEVVKIGQELGLTVFSGAEVTTKEEVHCLAFFENFGKLEAFQSYLDNHLPMIPNDVEKFGFQVWVDRNEEILGQEERLLISSINQSINEVEQKVRELNGIFIPAHIFRPSFSVYSQLGFMPFDIIPDAIGISANSNIEEQIKLHPELEKFTVLRSSDAHYPQHIGSHYSVVEMEEASFEEFRMALHNKSGRKVIKVV